MSAIQGLVYFDTNGLERLLAGQNVNLYQWDNNAWRIAAGWTLSNATVNLEAAQLIDKLLLTDGVQNMRSWDGTTFVDLGHLVSAVGDPPQGATILCAHAGRIFASGRGSTVAAGGGVAQTARDTIWASKLLEFGSGKWDHTQFSFRVGGGEGDPVKALASMQGNNLCVLKEASVWMVNTDPGAGTAAAWPVQRLSQGLGCVGARAWCGYQNDVLFMSQDGVRSVARMQAAAGQYEISPPISRPIQTWIERINWDYANVISAKSYRELCLFAVPIDESTTANYVLVFNARLGRWLGVWSGWTPACWEVTRFGGAQRLVYGDTTGRVKQWKDQDDRESDVTYLDDGAAIPTKLSSRALLFMEPVNDKDGYHAETRFSVSHATVRVVAVGDNVELRSWDHDLRRSGSTLPVDLPFNLSSPAPVTGRRGLRGLNPFNELYFRVESDSGWWALRNLTASAYLNMLQNQ